MSRYLAAYLFFFFNDTATTEIYTLSLHDALPIFPVTFDLTTCDKVTRVIYEKVISRVMREGDGGRKDEGAKMERQADRSEEHTSELQSRQYLVCRLLLEKKKKKNK